MKALRYQARQPTGKTQIAATKPCDSAADLALAYTPGVATPCRAIQRHPDSVYRYTNKGNLVAIVSNGTAVLGLENLGPLAAKPVMEGKSLLFKRLADIDAFDLELDAVHPEELVRVVTGLAPTFGGINLEDIRAPECFEVEEALRDALSSPVFHDDQHGTAIVVGAALLNGLEIQRKTLVNVRVVKLAACRAIAALARESTSFGCNYIIPMPLDSDLLPRVAAAVAGAAVRTGVASRPVKDLTAYADAVATRERLSREERTDLAPIEAEAYRR